MSKTLTVLLALALISCSGKKSEGGDEDSKAATPVQVTAAKKETIRRVVIAEAVLYPVVEAHIVPKISAPVKHFYAQRGDHVREGQMLAVLEARDLQASTTESRQMLEQADASFQSVRSATMPEDLTRAKADVSATSQALEAAKRVYESRENLVKEGALAQKVADDAKVALAQAQSAYDTAQQHLKSLETAGQPAQLRGSQAQLDAAKAHYESATALSSYAQIRSPISGVVSDRPVNLGDMASSGSALFSIVNISRIVARANIPISDAALIKMGMPAKIKAAGGELDGKVSVVSPAVDPNTTTLQVWVEAPNQHESLKPGATVQVEIAVGSVPDAVVVPTTALLASDEGGEKVMIAGADSLAHEQKVEAGVRDGDFVQIVNGVKAGDQVIVAGGLGLDDKAKIEIAKAEDEKK